MSDSVINVHQEVEVLLRAARETARDRIEYIATLGVPGVSEFHDEVLAELDKIVEAYVNPPAPAVEVERGFNIGDKVVITGEGFTRGYHGVQAGDVVTITAKGDGDWGSREAKFEDPTSTRGRHWYVYSETIPNDEGGADDEFERWGARVLTAEEQEIKVGDTVRILPIYDESMTPGRETRSGVEFEVAEVRHHEFKHGAYRKGPDSGLVSHFYVTGDPGRRGVWEAFIEKVYK